MKDNKLLAEYLGFHTEYGWRGNLMMANKYNLLTIIWHPDVNWNQLMRVVEKIRTELNEKEFRKSTGSIPYNHYDLHGILEMLCNSYIGKVDYTIEDIANACVEYIHNEKRV